MFFSVTFGVVVGDPACGGGDKHFNLRDQEGLLLAVIINSNTQIVAPNGQTAHCSDIAADSQVQVRGSRNAMTVSAQSVQLL